MVVSVFKAVKIGMLGKWISSYPVNQRDHFIRKAKGLRFLRQSIDLQGRGFSFPFSYPILPGKLEILLVFFCVWESQAQFKKIFIYVIWITSEEIVSKGLGWGQSGFFHLKWWIQYLRKDVLNWTDFGMRCSVKGEYSVTGYSCFLNVLL